MVLIVDEEIQGTKRVYRDIEALKNAILEELDGNIEEVKIKKRAVYDNSPGVKGLNN